MILNIYCTATFQNSFEYFDLLRESLATWHVRSYFATHIASYWRVYRGGFAHLRISQSDPRAWELWEQILDRSMSARFLALIFEDAFQSRLRKGFKRGYRSRNKIGICGLARRAEPSRAALSATVTRERAGAKHSARGLSSPRERSCRCSWAWTEKCPRWLSNVTERLRGLRNEARGTKKLAELIRRRNSSAIEEEILSFPKNRSYVEYQYFILRPIEFGLVSSLVNRAVRNHVQANGDRVFFFKSSYKRNKSYVEASLERA